MDDTRWNKTRWDSIPEDKIAETIKGFMGNEASPSTVAAYTQLMNAMYAYGISIINCEHYAKAAFLSVDRKNQMMIRDLRNELAHEKKKHDDLANAFYTLGHVLLFLGICFLLIALNLWVI